MKPRSKVLHSAGPTFRTTNARCAGLCVGRNVVVLSKRSAAKDLIKESYSKLKVE